jgi:hypothetical protein
MQNQRSGYTTQYLLLWYCGTVSKFSGLHAGNITLLTLHPHFLFLVYGMVREIAAAERSKRILRELFKP